MPGLDVPELRAYLGEIYPQALRAGFQIVEASPEELLLTLPAEEQHLRPGGTVAGPTLMLLADCAVYLAIMARLGRSAGAAVTSSLEIHFLRRAPPGELQVRARLVKVGRRLAVGLVELRGAGSTEPVGHATVTYALPDPESSAPPPDPDL